MIEAIVNRAILQPEISDHEGRYSKFLCNTPKKIFIFNLLSTPENISNALIVAKETGHAPILVFEKLLSKAIQTGEIEELDSHEKQFVGTVTCTIMEINGWKKSMKKQRFSTGIFKSAEIYKFVI